jgi:hypothetical protein
LCFVPFGLAAFVTAADAAQAIGSAAADTGDAIRMAATIHRNYLKIQAPTETRKKTHGLSSLDYATFMRCFDPQILIHLNAECSGDPIHHIGLGDYSFQLAFAGVERIQAMEKAVFSIHGKIYTWEDGPSDIPVWVLVGQIPTGFALASSHALRMNLASGDYVEFYTDESPYEVVMIDFGIRGDARVMEIY